MARRKGHQFERHIAKELKPIFPTARRGLQYRDGYECADVEGTLIRFELKRYKSFPKDKHNLVTKWFTKAIADAKEAKDRRPIVLVLKEDRKEALVIMDQTLAHRLSIKYTDPPGDELYFLVESTWQIFLGQLHKKLGAYKDEGEKRSGQPLVGDSLYFNPEDAATRDAGTVSTTDPKRPQAKCS